MAGRIPASPYSFTWNNLSPGSYVLTARSTDNDGAWTLSAPVSITVSSQPLVVSISRPTDHAVFCPGRNIPVSVNAQATAGAISRVELYAGTTLVGTGTSAPYDFVFQAPAVGDYALTAKAFDARRVLKMAFARSCDWTTLISCQPQRRHVRLPTRKNGAKSCWIVSPRLRTVTVLLPDGREEVLHRGVAEDPATGLKADLAKVFS